MPVRKILLYDDQAELLRKPSVQVRDAHEVRQLCIDLKATLRASPNAAGLAATQIGRHKRVFVAEFTGKGYRRGKPTVIINPVITSESDYKLADDGCLSVPGVRGNTFRPHRLTIWCIDEHNRPRTHHLEGFDAVVAHHEFDHLEGVLFFDRIEGAESRFDIKVLRVDAAKSELKRYRENLDRRFAELMKDKARWR